MYYVCIHIQLMCVYIYIYICTTYGTLAATAAACTLMAPARGPRYVCSFKGKPPNSSTQALLLSELLLRKSGVSRHREATPMYIYIYIYIYTHRERDACVYIYI